MTGKNVLCIMSDEHSRRVLGCYGNDTVSTPHLDRLAENGTLFENAYTNCPICVPARASFASGRHVGDIGNWDNAFPYHGENPGWGHRLIANGHRCDSIGKLHYRSSADPAGFSNEIMPLHVLDGTGDLQGMIRNPPPVRPSTKQLAADAGRGESSYTDYDRKIRDAAVEWLDEVAEKPPKKPWVAFVSFVCPHFPLVAPDEFYDLYDPADMPWPDLRSADEFPDHPFYRTLRHVQDYDDHFRDDDHRRVALAAYYGMVSFLDDNIGRLLEALDDKGLSEETVVLYTSDHGDNLGTRTMWGKSTMYEESAGVPLIMSGPGIARSSRVATPVSLVDFHQTVLEATGLGLDEDDRERPGHSLLEIAEGAETDRTILCEYHAVGSVTGVFMVRWANYKYVHFVGQRPQLFDLQADPQERRDLAMEADHDEVLAEGERRLREICDPEAVNARAFADQQARMEEFGGVDKVRNMGSYPYTPAPGEKPRYAGASGS